MDKRTLMLSILLITSNLFGDTDAALNNAIRGRDLAEIISLCKYGGATDRALCSAVRKGDLEEVASLIAKGAHVNADSMTYGRPIVLAAQHGHLNIAKYLLESGADIDAESRYIGAKGPALNEAVRKEDLNMVQLLISKGANVHGRLQRHPLHYAATSGNLQIIQCLIKAGADVNHNRLTRPLDDAVMSGNLQATECLIEAGADVNAKNCYGVTPIQYAMKVKNTNDAFFITQCLVEAGANIQEKNKYGETPLTTAKTQGHKRIVAYLKTHLPWWNPDKYL